MHSYQQLPETALRFLQQSLGVSPQEITGVQPTSAGMTNRSFRLCLAEQEYLLRVPGEGTDQLLNRRQEAETYRTLNGDPISDHVLAIDPDTGYKLTAYWQGTRNCDPENPEEVRRCMALLRAFHEKKLTVPHSFDLYGEISRYEALMGGKSVHPDYREVRGRCERLRSFLDRQEKQLCLAHIDAVPDNFLFVSQNGEETLHLIDWEYAGMNDPHLDIAMFAIYAGYDREKLDRLMDWYFVDGCSPAVRTKIYCYVALSGLLWSNWCEYKKALGVDFGDYAEMQYRYAAEYSRLVLEKGGVAP
jgi:thiamine kinase-like enzyme